MKKLSGLLNEIDYNSKVNNVKYLIGLIEGSDEPSLKVLSGWIDSNIKSPSDLLFVLHTVYYLMSMTDNDALKFRLEILESFILKCSDDKNIIPEIVKGYKQHMSERAAKYIGGS